MGMFSMLDRRLQSQHGWIQHAPFLHPLCMQTCALRAVVIFAACIAYGAPVDYASAFNPQFSVWLQGRAGNALHVLAGPVRRGDPQRQARKNRKHPNLP